ncbi:MAG: HAMP domain-containing histidine kinase [Myxococcales bacterium]|nr:HAMP domain-containing histidine kinase [Myxococcales bacterium]
MAVDERRSVRRTQGIPEVDRLPHELRADCLRLLSHDLNNPLTAIRILTEMLRDRTTDPQMRQDVIDILEAADLAGALMDGMSSLVLLESRRVEFTWFPIDLVHVLRQAVDRPALRRHVRFSLPREVQLTGDRMALHRAFTDVFVNARRVVDGCLEIPVWVEEQSKEITVRVGHPGPGIPPDLRGALFEPYGAVRLRQSRLPVAAAGLVYARTVVDHHGGSMDFRDTPGGEMELVVKLPR